MSRATSSKLGKWTSSSSLISLLDVLLADIIFGDSSSGGGAGGSNGGGECDVLCADVMCDVAAWVGEKSLSTPHCLEEEQY